MYCNLSAKRNFVEAIAKDERSYKPANFKEATRLMTTSVMKSPEELRVWDRLQIAVADAKAANEEEEEDLGEVPDEFMDPIMAELMNDPVILPTSKAVMDRSTSRAQLLSDPVDPYNRMPLKIEEVLPNTELKERIEAWKAERKAAKAAEKTGAMDTSEG